MKMQVNTHIDGARILRQRGLGGSHEAQRFLAEIVRDYSDPYVPMSAGAAAHMKGLVEIAPDGAYLQYRAPYAHYQYVGEVMAGRAPKHYTGKDLQYHGAPLRGKLWDKRMMADRRKDVEAAMDAYIRRKGR